MATNMWRFQKAMLQFLCEMGTTMGRLLSIFISSPQYCCVQCIRMKMKHVETEHLISVLFNMADGQKYLIYNQLISAEVFGSVTYMFK